MHFKTGYTFKDAVGTTWTVTQVQYRHDDGTVNDRPQLALWDFNQIVTFEDGNGNAIIREQDVDLFFTLSI